MLNVESLASAKRAVIALVHRYDTIVCQLDNRVAVAEIDKALAEVDFATPAYERHDVVSVQHHVAMV
jgi:hypothetical protein